MAAMDPPGCATVFILGLFHRFSRDEYKRTFGKDAPAFDPTRAPKYWADESATSEDDYMVYPEAVAVVGPNAVVKRLTIRLEEARTYNIPMGYANEIGVGSLGKPEVPTPIRARQPWEEIISKQRPGDNGPYVRDNNVAKMLEPTQPAVFTNRHAAIIEALAKTVGI